jgi:hypothetical protein
MDRLRKLLTLSAICAIVVATVAVRLLEPAVDQLAMALGIGIAGGPATPEAERLLADWSRLLGPVDALAAIAFLLVIVSGIPLAVFALVAKYWPSTVGVLVRNRTALWMCLTWQLANIGFTVLLTLFVASSLTLLVVTEGLGFTATVLVVALVDVAVNLWAVRVWRELLVRLNAAEVARVRPAVV